MCMKKSGRSCCRRRNPGAAKLDFTSSMMNRQRQKDEFQATPFRNGNHQRPIGRVLECADVSALWFDATCRVVKSGDVSPQSKDPRPFNFAATERRLAVGFETKKLKMKVEPERPVANGCVGKPVANRRSGRVTTERPFAIGLK